MHVNDLLKVAVEKGASDLHIKVGSYPMMRLRGALVPASEERRLNHEDVVAMSAAVMSNVHREKFKDAQEVDLAYSVPGLGRFRVNVFQQRGTVGLVLRVIPMAIKTIDEFAAAPRSSQLNVLESFAPNRYPKRQRVLSGIIVLFNPIEAMRARTLSGPACLMDISVPVLSL